ncbi:MAG: ABC transporter ATP-binding protein [Thermoplasmata archaeon]|nr:ABC transporter ATP-binding protein [Thermoplasmata archaeon]
MDMVVASELVKDYKKVKALRGFSFSVGEGEIFGLIGPNGAGKTTTIRIAATLLDLTGGTLTIDGKDIKQEAEGVREVISYLPEEAGAYKNLTGREYLQFMANFYRNKEEEIVRRGMEISGLEDRLDSRIKEYSKGMKRRLLIARTLMSLPKLAILDEPTGGLDVFHAHHVRQMIRGFASQHNVTVLLSSHNMLEVEYLCDRIVLIDNGVAVARGTPQGLVEEHGAKNLEDVFLEVVDHA